MSDAGHAFEELGLSALLATAAAACGYVRPTPIQRDAIPLLRRGNNVLIHASAGAGVGAAYGLALLDRLAAGDEAAAGGGAAPRALVLVPDDAAAHARARSLTRLGLSSGQRASPLGHPAAPGADVLFATPAAALRGVRASTLKLDALAALVVDGFDTLVALGEADALETLAASAPKDAQRVVVTAALDETISGFAERHVRRAVNVPARVLDMRPGPGESARREPARSLQPVSFLLATDDRLTERLARLLLQRAAGRALVVCRTAPEADALAAALALEGVRAGTGEDASVRVVTGGDDTDPSAYDLVVSHHPPFDADALRARHARGGAVVAAPRELAHLRASAVQAGITLTPEPEPASAAGDVEAFRDTLRRALDAEDIGAQLLVLEPLFAERPAAEVAAAAAALLRRRRPPAGSKAAAAEAAAAVTSAPSRETVASPVTAPAPPAYTRLFISVGERDGIGPGDLVGMIAGEAEIRGAQVGKIEIRDTFSIVEVDRDVGERVIRALNGTTVRGRSVRADFDRKPGASRGGGRSDHGRRPGRRSSPS